MSWQAFIKLIKGAPDGTWWHSVCRPTTEEIAHRWIRHFAEGIKLHRMADDGMTFEGYIHGSESAGEEILVFGLVETDADRLVTAYQSLPPGPPLIEISIKS